MDSREKQKEKYPLHEAILEIIRKLKSKKEYEVFHNILPKSYKIYHDTIEDPVSFSSIVPRLKKDPTIINFYESLHLIVSNCQKFNESGSEIVKISKELERDIERYMKKYDLLEELDRERAGKASHLAREYDAMDRDKARSKRQVQTEKKRQTGWGGRKSSRSPVPRTVGYLTDEEYDSTPIGTMKKKSNRGKSSAGASRGRGKPRGQTRSRSNEDEDSQEGSRARGSKGRGGSRSTRKPKQDTPATPKPRISKAISHKKKFTRAMEFGDQVWELVDSMRRIGRAGRMEYLVKGAQRIGGGVRAAQAHKYGEGRFQINLGHFHGSKMDKLIEEAERIEHARRSHKSKGGEETD